MPGPWMDLTTLQYMISPHTTLPSVVMRPAHALFMMGRKVCFHLNANIDIVRERLR